MNEIKDVKFEEYTDAQLKDWVTVEIALRNSIANHCLIAGVKVTFDYEINTSLLMYSEDMLLRLAKVLDVLDEVECVENEDCFSASCKYCWKFKYDGVCISAYSSLPLNLNREVQ